jgi:predicted amidohydrolase
VTRIAAVCAERNIYAIVGTVWLDEGVRRNAALVLGPDGKLVHRYYKMHVVEPYNRNGDRLAFFLIDGVPATLFICHDERYPELMRIPVLGGARIAFCISFESPAASGKSFNYRCQIVGRAIENQTWVVHCNAPAENQGNTSHGHSRIIAPDGTIEQEAGEGQEVIRHVVDTGLSSQEWVRAAAVRPPFDRFWREGLRVLQQQNPGEFAGQEQIAGLTPDAGWSAAARLGNSPNARLRIACVQMPISDDLQTNTAKAVSFIEAQARQRLRVVVFPERALTGDQAVDQERLCSAVAVVAEACRENNVYCIIGAAFREDGRLYNGGYVIDPAGSVIKRYGQIYPDRPEFAAGIQPAMFRIDGVYATVMIGHDIHYPELSRIAVLGGARILFCLAWERADASVFAAESQVVCRSVENQTFMIWCNAGRQDSSPTSSTGHSRIVNPAGQVLAQATAESDIAIRARVDTAQASYNYPRAGAGTPSLRGFWQEGLRVLWAANPEFENSNVKIE